MPDFSFGKLVVLAVIIAVVWSAFKYAHRIEEIRRAVRREAAGRRQAAQRERGPALAAEDLVKCARCGAYVAAHSTAACGRADCPWGR
ncbi:MAG TPA: hypothetical protein VMU87_12770 [Stellaceae bacterium]|nr:hypothetical protein [Stellaceae bacterium]